MSVNFHPELKIVVTQGSQHGAEAVSVAGPPQPTNPTAKNATRGSGWSERLVDGMCYCVMIGFLLWLAVKLCETLCKCLKN